jgi:flagellar hook-associated protein 3 FlgL
MRVTDSETYRNFLANIENLNERLNKTSNEVSSGKKLTQLKDSPADSAQLVAISQQASEIDQYQSNIDSGAYLMGMADSILNEVQNLTTSVYAKGSQSASEVISSDERATIANEIRSTRDQIMSLANSQALGRYLFAGSKTGSVPFTANGDTVTYQGNEDANKISIDDGLEIQTGIPGSDAFNAIFSAIDSLLTNMDSNNLSGIQTALGDFTSAMSELGLVRGQVGNNLNMLNNTKNILGSRETSLAEQKSRLEDADLAGSIVQLSQMQTALQTAISSGGLILQQRNLFDILG